MRDFCSPGYRKNVWTLNVRLRCVFRFLLYWVAGFVNRFSFWVLTKCCVAGLIFSWRASHVGEKMSIAMSDFHCLLFSTKILLCFAKHFFQKSIRVTLKCLEERSVLDRAHCDWAIPAKLSSLKLHFFVSNNNKCIIFEQGLKYSL